MNPTFDCCRYVCDSRESAEWRFPDASAGMLSVTFGHSRLRWPTIRKSQIFFHRRYCVAQAILNLSADKQVPLVNSMFQRRDVQPELIAVAWLGWRASMYKNTLLPCSRTLYDKINTTKSRSVYPHLCEHVGLVVPGAAPARHYVIRVC